MRRTFSAIAVVVLCACTQQKEGGVLRVSMIPTTDPTKAIRELQPLKDRLSRAAGVPVDFTIPNNYAAVVEALVNDQLDIAFLGGFTYVQAVQRASVRPLVQRERDQNFHTLFVTQPGSRIQSLNDLAGHSFAFGDVNSTSGHLMPEYYMRQANVHPQVIAKAIYTGGHDATLLAVSSGKVDAGALDEAVFQRLTTTGKVDPKSIRVFSTTPAFFDYVWVARKGLPDARAKAVADAFLSLDASDPAQKGILDSLSASRYVPADDKSYDKLREAARTAGLLK
jgi:phosphonate transport system substrate-binding protein